MAYYYIYCKIHKNYLRFLVDIRPLHLAKQLDTENEPPNHRQLIYLLQLSPQHIIDHQLTDDCSKFRKKNDRPTHERVGIAFKIDLYFFIP